MTDAELFNFVHDAAVKDPFYFLCDFEPWRMPDIEKISERYSIPVSQIEEDLANYHVNPSDDLIVADGHSFFPCPLHAWADSVRDFLSCDSLTSTHRIPSMTVDLAVDYLIHNEVLFNPDHKDLYIPIIKDGNLHGVEVVHFSLFDDEILSIIDKRKGIGNSLVDYAFTHMPDPKLDNDSCSLEGRRIFYKFDGVVSCHTEVAKLELGSFVFHHLAINNTIAHLVPEQYIIGSLQFKSLKEMVFGVELKVKDKKEVKQEALGR